MSACGHWRVDANRTRLAAYISVTSTCTSWADQGYAQCNQWADQGSNQCTQWADQGSSQCSQWADQGHNSCCTWAPCSWFCDALVWIADWVCTAAVWVAKWVCLAAVWVAKWVCLAAVWIAKWVCLAVAWIVSVIWYLIIVLIWEACRPFGSGGARASPINHVFVLMLENRAFDHMLGFSQITGVDAVSGTPRPIVGLHPGVDASHATELNSWGGADFHATETALWAMPIDPGHEFADTLMELCFTPEHATAYDPSQGYPPITNAGFVANWAGQKGGTSEDIMGCYRYTADAEQLPVLHQLAQEFAVCDNYFSSMPGPTWPNRFFIHAATSGGLDDSPQHPAVAGTVDGFKFQNGTIYDLLEAEGFDWRIYTDDIFPQSLAISGMNLALVEGRFPGFDDFAEDVNDPEYSTAYAFIEPNYGNDLTGQQTFKCGNSQHPMDDVTRGEHLIRSVYETIRNSPHWDDSLLVITYDEHGGFFDHVAPPPATPPGDKITVDMSDHANNFKFDQLGVRVPAVVISPRIPKGTLDGRLYDHASVVKTIEDIFELEHLTDRDAMALSMTPLLSLQTPRTDAPTKLVKPADSGIRDCDDPPVDDGVSQSSSALTAGDKTADGAAMDPALRGFVHVALLRELATASKDERVAAIGRYRKLQTRGQAAGYLREARALQSRPSRELPHGRGPKRRVPRRRRFPRFR